MRRRTLLLLATFLLLKLPSIAQDHFSLTGEVSQDQTFRQDIGYELDFLLEPNTMDPGNVTGWIISVVPHDKPFDPQCNDFVWVVTPPFRFQNARYIDTSYSTTAQEAVQASPREFNFVLNCADFEVEHERVSRVLWPYSHSKKEVDEARAKLGSSPVGKGQLWIQEYWITRGHRSSEGVEVGQIHWIKFRVDIRFPSGKAASARSQ